MKKLTWKTGGLYDSISYIDGIFEYRTDGSREQNLLHIMDNRSRIAMIRIGNSFGDSMPDIQYNLEDNLGSSVMHLKDDGANLNKEEYYPFGETSFGSYAEKRYKYCAKERDNESGLYYYGARYYAAWTCRFISVDPLAADYPYLTPYNYAGNKPIGDYDIDGMQSTGDPPLAAAGGGAGSTPVPASTSAPNSITAKTEVVPTQKPTIDVTKLPIREPDILQGPDDVGYWMSHDNYNPEMAHFVETKNAAAKATGADKALIWLGYGLQKTGEYGSVIVATKTPVEPTKLPTITSPNKMEQKPLSNGTANPKSNVIPEGKAANHIFSGRDGKFSDTQTNREIITNLSNDASNLKTTDTHGKSWYAKTLSNGTEIYSYTQNGVIKGAGINQIPRFNFFKN